MTHKLFHTNNYTIGDLYNAVFAIHEPDLAVAFYDDYIAWALENADVKYRSQSGAEYLVRSNIGWIFGEGMPQADIDMWSTVCKAAHPIFGNMSTPPTADEAFKDGMDYVKPS